MTVEEMKEAIKNKCINTDCDECCLCPLYDNKGNCYESLKSEEIKRNYELMFGNEKLKMKNEFDFNELKTGWAIKLPSGSFCVGMQMDENEITFFERFDNGELSAVCTKEDIINNECRNEHEISFYPIEVYGYSENYELFDTSTRPLLYKKEDMNFKIYKIGNLEIKPNYETGALDPQIKGYKTEKEDFLFIENMNEDEDEYITINKSELNDVINALTEIRDFIKED